MRPTALTGVDEPAREFWRPGEAALLVLVMLAALGLRWWQLGGQLVWLDEVYSFELVRRGPAAIVANSLHDPHPPGWYLVFWLTTGFGQLRSEIGLRWHAAVAGALTVALVYLLARRHAGRLAAAGAALAFAASPLHVFFSQEARPPALLTLAAAASALALERVIARPESRRALLALVATALAGLYLGYFFVLVAGVQALALLALRRWRAAAIYCGALAVLGAPAAFFFFSAIPEVAAKHSEAATSLLQFVQILVGGDGVRFGFAWWHPLLLALLGLPALAGASAARRDPALAYHAAQVFLPIAAFWLLLVGILGVGLPLDEAKQFMVLLPSLFVLVAAGFDLTTRRLPARAGAAFVVAVCAVAVAAGVASSARAWAVGKSPEGAAAMAVVAAPPGEGRIFLAYSPADVFRFYHPGEAFFAYPEQTAAGWELYAFPHDGPGPPPRVAAATVLADPRLRLVYDSRRADAGLDWLRSHCAEETPAGGYGPFVVVELAGCAP